MSHEDDNKNWEFSDEEKDDYPDEDEGNYTNTTPSDISPIQSPNPKPKDNGPKSELQLLVEQQDEGEHRRPRRGGGRDYGGRGEYRGGGRGHFRGGRRDDRVPKELKSHTKESILEDAKAYEPCEHYFLNIFNLTPANTDDNIKDFYKGVPIIQIHRPNSNSADLEFENKDILIKAIDLGSGKLNGEPFYIRSSFHLSRTNRSPRGRPDRFRGGGGYRGTYEKDRRDEYGGDHRGHNDGYHTSSYKGDFKDRSTADYSKGGNEDHPKQSPIGEFSKSKPHGESGGYQGSKEDNYKEKDSERPKQSQGNSEYQKSGGDGYHRNKPDYPKDGYQSNDYEKGGENQKSGDYQKSGGYERTGGDYHRGGGGYKRDYNSEYRGDYKKDYYEGGNNYNRRSNHDKEGGEGDFHEKSYRGGGGYGGRRGGGYKESYDYSHKEKAPQEENSYPSPAQGTPASERSGVTRTRGGGGGGGGGGKPAPPHKEQAPAYEKPQETPIREAESQHNTKYDGGNYRSPGGYSSGSRGGYRGRGGYYNDRGREGHGEHRGGRGDRGGFRGGKDRFRDEGGHQDQDFALKDNDDRFKVNEGSEIRKFTGKKGKNESGTGGVESPGPSPNLTPATSSNHSDKNKYHDPNNPFSILPND